MRIQVLALAFIMAIISCAPNYQQRVIYLDEDDNVCAQGQHSDLIQLTFDIGSEQPFNIAAYGSTQCSESAHFNIEKIRPQSYWGYQDTNHGSRIEFRDETTWISQGEVVFGIIQKSTIKNPAKLNGSYYDCIILGDGLVHHFGVKHPVGAYAKIALKCIQKASNHIDMSNFQYQDGESDQQKLS